MSGQGKSCSVYNELRLDGKFCDAVIKVEDVEFQIHKTILCNCSPYFRALFERWSTTDQKAYNIPGLSPDIMRLIIEFAYTGSLYVTENNVQDLMKAGDMLNVMDIVQMCSDFLCDQLCPENCIGIWKFTNICFSTELQRTAYAYIISHFEEVLPCKEFLQLSVQELSEIIGRDDLNVRMEKTVFEAILRWMAHKPEERERHLAELFPLVRLALTGLDFIRINVMSNQLVHNNSKCLQTVHDAIQTFSHRMNHPSSCDFFSPLACPRLPNAILLAIGGWSVGDPTNAIEAYDVRSSRWINVTNNMERPRAYHGAAFLNGHVYCVGGFDRVEHFSSVRRFDLSSRTWHEAAPMHYRRCYVSVTVLNGCIYAMGGYDGHSRLSTAECYKPETNQWSLIAPMHEQRSDASSATLCDKVYICGGFNGNECLQTAESYLPETNQWTMIQPMISRRSGIGVVAYAGHVYAVGGFDGSNRLCTAEVYSPYTNSWRNVCPMLTPRSNFGIEVIDDRLFAVGGFNGFTTTYNVESYDATTDEWSAACDMEIFRSALSCCVVFGLPNMAEYASPRNILPVLHLEDEVEEFVCD